MCSVAMPRNTFASLSTSGLTARSTTPDLMAARAARLAGKGSALAPAWMLFLRMLLKMSFTGALSAFSTKGWSCVCSCRPTVSLASSISSAFLFGSFSNMACA